MVRVRDVQLAKQPRLIDNYGVPSINAKDKYKATSLHNVSLQKQKQKQKQIQLLSLQTMTKIIATIQILFSTAMLLLINVLSQQIIESYIEDNGWKINLLEASSAVGLFFGFILLAAAHFGIRGLLLFWLIVTGGGLTTLLLIRCLIICKLLIAGGMLYFLHLVPPTCLTIIFLACLYVVNLYRKQLSLQLIQEAKAKSAANALTSLHQLQAEPKPQNFSRFTG